MEGLCGAFGLRGDRCLYTPYVQICMYVEDMLLKRRLCSLQLAGWQRACVLIWVGGASDVYLVSYAARFLVLCVCCDEISGVVGQRHVS